MFAKRVRIRRVEKSDAEIECLVHHPARRIEIQTGAEVVVAEPYGGGPQA
jgi:hypothetical protein